MVCSIAIFYVYLTFFRLFCFIDSSNSWYFWSPTVYDRAKKKKEKQNGEVQTDMLSRFMEILCCISTVSSSAIANPVEHLNLTESLLPLNATSLSALDPRFHITRTFGSINVPATSCLMNAVEAMADLALSRYDDRVDPKTYNLQKYPDVKITIQAVPAGGLLKTSYVVWGLYGGIGYMVRNNRFQCVKFYLRWNGDLVGLIDIDKVGPQLSIAGSNQSQSQSQIVQRSSALESIVNRSTNLTGLDTGPPVLFDPRLSILIERTGENLPIFAVFMTVLCGMEYAAQFPSTSRVSPFGIYQTGQPYDTAVWFQDYESKRRRSPPFLEYQWVIKSLAQLPGFMFGEGRFTEVEMVIEVDGIRVGEAYVGKRS